jgi:hypothetical protein
VRRPRLPIVPPPSAPEQLAREGGLPRPQRRRHACERARLRAARLHRLVEDARPRRCPRCSPRSSRSS